MATTTINEPKEIVLPDGTKLSVRPLKISLLREFMKKFDGIAAVAEDNEKSMDILLECVQIAMKQYSPELATDVKALEEILDLPTVYQIVEEASGINLGNSPLGGI
jgi:inhibitor of KinA sporulation pathway (predicted exonuclease)